VAIDTSGEWWVGDRPEDIGEFLTAYASDGYEVHEFRLAQCVCGSVEFELEADDNEGVARRTCASCGSAHHICDSAEYWNEANPETWKCVECGSKHANVGVGFSLYDDDSTAIRWLYVGERCARWGVLGCFAGWKVGMSGVLHLINEV
jgi:hypothetical protein